MRREKYKQIVDKISPKENRIANILVAFITGGLMGLIGEFLVDFYSYIWDIPSKDAAVFMIITLIGIASLFTALGFFDNWVKFAKAGLIIPITGFAHAMMSAALEYRKEGLVTGIGSNMFKLAGSVIVYGVVTAYFVGLIRFLFMGG